MPRKARVLYRRSIKPSRQGLIRSCHDCSDGGLGVALAETAFAGGFGMEIDLRKVPRSGLERNDLLLFSESQSRFVVTLDPSKKKAFEDPSGRCRLRRNRRGFCTTRIFRVMGLAGKIIIEANIYDLKEAWQKPLKF